MKITKRCKCEVCEAPITLVKDFPVTVNMFDVNANPLSGELLEEIKAWRRQKLYCDEHKLDKEKSDA
jgi:hypothetical protein